MARTFTMVRHYVCQWCDRPGEYTGGGPLRKYHPECAKEAARKRATDHYTRNGRGVPAPPRDVTCKACGSSFQAQGYGPSRYCSDECNPQVVVARDVACRCCGEEFTQARKDQLWCLEPECRRHKTATRDREQRERNPGVNAERCRRYKMNNPEEYRESARKSGRKRYQNNLERARKESQRNARKRRARRAGNGVFVISDRDQARLDASACAQCGSWDRLEVDHIIPISRGGTHSIGNLQILCLSCNRSKNNKLQVEWLVARGELDERIRPASS